jgi:hypothetical protein
MTIRYVGGELFMNTSGWPAAVRRCWLRTTAADLAAIGLTGAADARPPAAHLAALETVEANSVDDGLILGTADARASVSLFGAAVLRGVRDPGRITGRLNTLVGVEHGKVVVLGIRSDGLAKILTAAGAQLTADQQQASVDYSRQGAPVTVAAPPEHLQMTDDDVRTGRCG